MRPKYRPEENIKRKGYCEVAPCDQKAVAVSNGGAFVCLGHAYYLGGFELMDGFEGLGDFVPSPEVER